MRGQSERQEIDVCRTEMCLRLFADEVSDGLSSAPKTLPCKYLYDEEGSRLFKEIMELQEYYPTRCEAEILERHKGRIAAALGSRDFNLVELGAGDGAKTKILLRHFLEAGLRFNYVPIDISNSALQELRDDLRREFPGLIVQGLATEYFEGLRWLAQSYSRTNLILFLGSNIGNFTPSESRSFLSGLWNATNGNDLVLIGFDLKKDLDTMLLAYNDHRGVTARFNINILRRINGELGGNFDLSNFEYYSTYNPTPGAIESFLISRKRQNVYIDLCGRAFSFAEWEPIHTESSYKFDRGEFNRLAWENGFEATDSFSDSRRYFADVLWRVRK